MLKEIEQMKRINHESQQKLMQSQALELRKLPKKLKSDTKTRQLMYKESLRISIVTVTPELEKEKIKEVNHRLDFSSRSWFSYVDHNFFCRSLIFYAEMLCRSSISLQIWILYADHEYFIRLRVCRTWKFHPKILRPKFVNLVWRKWKVSQERRNPQNRKQTQATTGSPQQQKREAAEGTRRNACKYNSECVYSDMHIIRGAYFFS